MRRLYQFHELLFACPLGVSDHDGDSGAFSMPAQGDRTLLLACRSGIIYLTEIKPDLIS
jgi:hypothetical protein